MFGGTVLPLYGLYVANTNDQLKPNQMVAASSSLYMAVAVGATLGPSLTGWIMDLVGPGGFLWYFAATHLAMVVFTLYRMTRTEPPESEERAAYRPVPGRTGELAESWVEGITQAEDTAPDNTKT